MGPKRAKLEGDLIVEVDGPGLHLRTVDPKSFLEFAASFVGLLLENAAERKATLTLSRVRLIEKCAALAVRPNDEVLAKEIAAAAARQISGEEEAPHGGNQYVERVRASIDLFPSASKFKVALNGWQLAITTAPAGPARPLDSILSIRARPVRVGGKVPRARFASLLEPEEFSLAVSEEQARQLGGLLYKDVEISALVRRAPDDTIQDGKLERFELVEDRDALEAWREWGASVRRKAT